MCVGQREVKMPRKKEPTLIRVDHRESGSGVPEFLRSLSGVVVQIEQLDVADYVLSQRLAVERKSAADLAASILDKRLFAQVEQLKSAYQRVVYLIEGASLYDASHLHPNAIRGALAYLVVLNDVATLRSDGPEDSAQLLATMARQEQQGLGYEVSGHPKRRPSAPDLQMRYLVEDLPGIGPKRARALLERFGSLSVLFAATEEELSRVSGIGVKTARELRELLCRPFANGGVGGIADGKKE
jgi:ERCC4-type nuclease